MGKAQLHNDLVGKRVAGGRLEFVSVLGLGAYGVVYLARDLQHPLHSHQAPWDAAYLNEMPNGHAAVTGLYAVKCLHHLGLDARQQLFQQREVSLHNVAGSHPAIVTLYQVLQDASCIYVIMDYCPDGDLFAMITEKQRYTVPAQILPGTNPAHIMSRFVVEDEKYFRARADMDAIIKQVFGQIVEAVQYCHQLGIYHRDLKPENILCLEGGMRIMLADFGLATTDQKSTDFGCGSTFYMGPECQGGILNRPKHYDASSNDVWSLGVILVNLVCGRNPWKQVSPSDETFREFLRNPDFLLEILPISESLNTLLKRVFSPFPESRCSIFEVNALLQSCDRLTATNTELEARQENRRLAQARAQAARARSALDEQAAAAATSAHVRKAQLIDEAVRQEPYRKAGPPKPPAPVPSYTPFPSKRPERAAAPPRSPVLFGRRSLRHHKSRSLANGQADTSSALSPSTYPDARHNSLSRPKRPNNTDLSPIDSARCISSGLPAETYADALACRPGEDFSMPSTEPGSPATATRRPSAASTSSSPSFTRRGSLAALSRMVQHGRSAVPSILDTLNPFPPRSRAGSRLDSPLQLQQSPVSDGKLVPPPKLAVDFGSEPSTDDEQECLSPPDTAPTVYEPAYTEGKLRQQTQPALYTPPPPLLPPFDGRSARDERYRRVLVNQQG